MIKICLFQDLSHSILLEKSSNLVRDEDKKAMIIIVMGLPGSGKSFFAELFAKKIKARYFSSDRVRNTLKMRGQYSFDEKLYIYEWLANLTEGVLDEKTSVVVDATFYLQRTRDLFIEIANRRNVAIKFVMIESPELLVKQRLEKARRDSEADYKVFKKIRREFEEMTLPYLHLTSTSDNIDLMMNSAMEFIEFEKNETA